MDELYKDQKGKEQGFVGLLQMVNMGTIQFTLIDTFHREETREIMIGEKTILEMVKVPVQRQREIFIGDMGEILAPFIGKQVKIVGKCIVIEKEYRQYNDKNELANIKVARYDQIWPATIAIASKVEVAAKELGKPDSGGKEVKIEASSATKLVVKDGGTTVIRSAKELLLAEGSKEAGADAEHTATINYARYLKVGDIDWKKQMLIAVSGGIQRTGGYSVEIKSIVINGDKMVVSWKLNAPKPDDKVTQALTHPQRVVLVPRFEGIVEFDPPPMPGNAKKKFQ